VLLAHPRHHDVRAVEQRAEPLALDAARGLAAERLRARVDHRLALTLVLTTVASTVSAQSSHAHAPMSAVPRSL